MLKEMKYTQGIYSGGYSNDNTTSEFSTLQSHTIKDGSIYRDVVLSVKVDVSGVLCHMELSDTTDMMMVGVSGSFCHMD